MHSPDDNQYPLGQPKRSRLPRRAVSKKDFSLPKPYRRQLFSEEPNRLTRLQISLLAFAGLLIATLAGVLALLAHESARSPRGKVIVAAARLEAARLEAADPGEERMASIPVEAPSPIPNDNSDLPPSLQTRPVAQARPQLEQRAPHAAQLRAVASKKALPDGRKAAPESSNALADRRKATLLGRKALPEGRTAGPDSRRAAPEGRKALAKLVHDKKPKPAVRKEPAPAVESDPDAELITAILLLTPAPLRAAPAEPTVRTPEICTGTVVKDGCVELHKMKP